MKNRGIVLIGVIIIIVALSIVALGMVSYFSEGLRLDAARANQEKALYAAQAGVMKAIVSYRNNGNITKETNTQLGDNFYYSFGGAGMFFLVNSSSPSIILNRELRQITMTNTNSTDGVTITHMQVSWTPDGGERIISIDLGQGSEEWTGTASSGTNIDITDYAIPASTTENYVWFDWAVGNNITALTITVKITFSDSSTAEFVILDQGLGSTNAMEITSTGKAIEANTWRRTLKVRYDVGTSEIISWEESQDHL